MRKVTVAVDHVGHELLKGDTVATLSDNFTGRICDLAGEDGQLFVQVRPVFQSYGKGVWHSADHIRWLATPKSRK